MAEPKLTHDQRMMALRMYGEGHRYADIQRQLKIDFGISLHHESIRSTCDSKVNQPFIEKFRAAYLSRISEVPISNKRIRIDDLEEVRGRILKVIKKNPLETTKQRSEFLALSGRLISVLQQAREETEKRPELMASFTVDEFSTMSDEELMVKRSELLAKVKRSIQLDENKALPLLEVESENGDD